MLTQKQCTKRRRYFAETIKEGLSISLSINAITDDVEWSSGLFTTFRNFHIGKQPYPHAVLVSRLLLCFNSAMHGCGVCCCGCLAGERLQLGDGARHQRGVAAAGQAAGAAGSDGGAGAYARWRRCAGRAPSRREQQFCNGHWADDRWLICMSHARRRIHMSSLCTQLLSCSFAILLFLSSLSFVLFT